MEFIKQNRVKHPGPGFWESEQMKFERLISILDKEWGDLNWFDKYQKQREDFVKFVDEHDRRRGSNFLETFPEMSDFYKLIKDE